MSEQDPADSQAPGQPERARPAPRKRLLFTLNPRTATDEDYRAAAEAMRQAGEHASAVRDAGGEPEPPARVPPEKPIRRAGRGRRHAPTLLSLPGEAQPVVAKPCLRANTAGFRGTVPA